MDASDRPPGAVPPSSTRCPRCKVAFDCGGSTRPFECWCAGMPPLPDEGRQAGAPLSGCLCPACYADALAASSGRGGAGDAGAAGR
ncbi:MAG TPA: cysteine-rich CWC family protein [Trinickia sp.]